MPGLITIRLTVVRLFLFFLWIIPGLSFAQNENRLTQELIINTKQGDIESNANKAMLTIDSIAHTNTIPGYFCKVYNKSMQNITSQIQYMNSGTRAFIQKFEIGFAGYFLIPYYANTNGDALIGSVWKCYYSNGNAKQWQYVLLGVNAHINGDFWHVLVDNFSEREIRFYKKDILATQPSIVKVYDDVFDTIKSQSSYLRFINFLTFGSVKKFGERTFFKWRKRAVNLAIMYYHDPEKFKRRLAIVNRKKENIDRQILRYRS